MKSFLLLPTRTAHGLCIALLAACCLAPVSAAPFVSSRGYSLDVPVGCHIKPEAGDDVTMKFEPKNDAEGTPSFEVEITPQGDVKSLETFHADMSAVYKKNYPEFIIRSQMLFSVDGVRASQFVVVQFKDNLPVCVQQIDLLKNGVFYTFRAAYLEKYHMKYDPIITRMVASVRWRTPTAKSLIPK